MSIEIVDIVKMGVDIVILVVLPVTGFLAVRVLTDMNENQKNLSVNQKEITKDLKEMRVEHGKLAKDFYILSGEYYGVERRIREREKGGE